MATHIASIETERLLADADLPGVPFPADAHAAVVVDLPGADAVYMGLSLAARGFRPVPLFNGTYGPSPVIDVVPIARALVRGAERMVSCALSPDAPPAFLLDSRRQGVSVERRPGSYDNRWVVLPQDFPSGALLANRGITTATVIQRGSASIAADLTHVLRRWQDSAIHIRVFDLASERPGIDVAIPKPSGFKAIWYAAIVLLGLRRSNVGGFGSVIPEEAGHGGFGG